MPSILPEEKVRRALETIYRLNGNLDKFKLMPIQVQADGSLADRKYSWHAWPQYTLVYVDCLALHVGLREPALRNLRAFDRVVREVNRSPWAITLWHDARTGKPDFGPFMGMDWYMNTPASWWTLSAVSGCHLNHLEGVLEYCPESLQVGETLPVITPRCWASLERIRADQFAFRVARLFGVESLRIEQVKGTATAADSDPSRSQEFTSAKTLREGDALEWSLEM